MYKFLNYYQWGICSMIKNGSTYLKNMSLLEAFDIALESFPNYRTAKYKSLKDFITDDNKSAEFINNIVYDGEKVFDLNNAMKVSHGRARHSVLSFLYGLCLGKFMGLFGSISGVFNDDRASYINDEIGEPYINHWLWLITSTNHDYGYYSKFLKDAIDLGKLGLSNNLLEDSHSSNYNNLNDFSNKFTKVFKNTYQQIINYYKYSIYYHSFREDDEEKCDHGVLGAVLIYDRVARKLKNATNSIEYSTSDMNRNESYKDILFYKAACLTIAQHNVFKSNDLKTDEIYKEYNLNHLLSNSDYCIGMDTPLLALLSLVDTIECVKKFSKSETEEHFLQTITVLEKINIDVKENEIIIDYHNLYDYLLQKEYLSLMTIYKQYLDNVKGLGKWTVFYIEEIEENVIKISIKNI